MLRSHLDVPSSTGSQSQCTSMEHIVNDSENRRSSFDPQEPPTWRGTVLASLGYDIMTTGARVNEAAQPIAASKNGGGRSMMAGEFPFRKEREKSSDRFIQDSRSTRKDPRNRCPMLQ